MKPRFFTFTTRGNTMSHRRLPRPSLLALALAHLALVPALATPAFAAETAGAAKAAVQRSYDIPAGPLEAALNHFGREAGITLGFSTGLTAGLRSPGLQGSHDLASGLARLLQGTGLAAEARGDGSYTLYRLPAAQGEVTLAPVAVTAQLARPGDLPEAYAGGQVARGGRLGLLGNVDVMDAPFNITNYTSQLIEDQQASTVQDVLLNEPSVRQSSPSGGAMSYYTIRGFDVSTSELAINGLYGMAPSFSGLSAEFAERVEVLKGPSALLYGMSPLGAVGGAVNLIPKRADDQPLTRLTLGVESDALWRGHVDMGRRFGAVGEWGLRFNGSYNNGDGYLDGQKKGGHLGALALDYRGERLRMSLDAVRSQEKQHGGAPLWAIVGNWGSGASWLSSMPAAPDGRTNILPGAPETKRTTEAVILGGEYDFNDRWTGFAKLGVQRYEVEGIWPGTVLNVQANGDGLLLTHIRPMDMRTTSAETGLRGRFKTGAVSHALALSASYLNRDGSDAFGIIPIQPTNIYEPTPIPAWPAPPAPMLKTSESTLSGIALADTMGFMDDRVLLTLGVRRQNVKADSFDDSGAVTSSYDASAWSPMAGLVVKPTDGLSLYANYIQGLSEGTTVGSGYQNAGQVFPPYKTKQIEVGTKLQTGRFTNTISVFQIEKPSTLTDNSTSPLPMLRMNGEQRNRGIEWTIFGELTRGLRVLGGVTYMQGRLSKTQDGLQDGNQAPGSSPWAANLGVDWDVPSLPGLALSSRVIHTGRQYVDNANTLKLPSWTRLDLGARYSTQLSGKPVVFRANVANVFNRNYWQSGFYSGYATLGAPRVFRLSASVDF
ncbi:TonB-dependent siderophore receptor [Thauera butanivorans]|uniref:TonB-dependent siderophore receptor n=1 Tax=Thauera butanivorans TaxID=86174 RepID=UPI003AB2954E